MILGWWERMGFSTHSSRACCQFSQTIIFAGIGSSISMIVARSRVVMISVMASTKFSSLEATNQNGITSPTQRQVLNYCPGKCKRSQVRRMLFHPTDHCNSLFHVVFVPRERSQKRSVLMWMKWNQSNECLWAFSFNPVKFPISWDWWSLNLSGST